MEFLVVDQRSAYHGVLRRLSLKKLWGVTSTHHPCMKFLMKNGIAIVKVTNEILRNAILILYKRLNQGV